MLKSAASDFECEARADVIGILMPGLAVILLWGFSLIWLNFGAWRSVVKPSKYLWFFYPEGLERKDPIWEALFFRWVAKKQQAKLVDVPNRKNTAKILYRPVNILLQLAVREKRERKNSRWASSGPITPLMGVITAGTHLESHSYGACFTPFKTSKGPTLFESQNSLDFFFCDTMPRHGSALHRSNWLFRGPPSHFRIQDVRGGNLDQRVTRWYTWNPRAK